MKIFNYILSSILGTFSLLQMFYIAETNLGFIVGFICLLTSFMFFTFGLIDEKNEEIDHLKNKIRRYEKMLMIGE